MRVGSELLSRTSRVSTSNDLLSSPRVPSTGFLSGRSAGGQLSVSPLFLTPTGLPPGLPSALPFGSNDPPDLIRPEDRTLASRLLPVTSSGRDYRMIPGLDGASSRSLHAIPAVTSQHRPLTNDFFQEPKSMVRYFSVNLLHVTGLCPNYITSLLLFWIAANWERGLSWKYCQKTRQARTAQQRDFISTGRSEESF